MKNGNLYKLAALLMAMILLSAIGFAQSDKKEIKKKKTMMITMTVDDDGETTKLDTIVLETPDVDMDEIMKEIDIQMDINKEKMKEIHMQIEAEMDELSETYTFEFKEHKEELKKAMKELKAELKNLELEEDIQKRIQEAMDKVEEAGKVTRTHMDRFVIDDAHPVFFAKDGKYQIITDKDGDQVETKVIVIGDDEDGKEKNIKVWVDEDNKHQVIVESDGEVISDESFFIYKDEDVKGKKVIKMELDGANMSMLTASKEKDIEKAIAAGLPIDKNKMFEEMNLFVEIMDDEAPIIKIQTEAEGKLKATAYDKDFNKLKKLKVTEEDGKSAIQMKSDELKDSKAAFILLEQGGKTDLMSIHQ